MFTKTLRGVASGLNYLANRYENRRPWDTLSFLRLLFGILLALPSVGVFGLFRSFLQQADIITFTWAVFVTIGGTFVCCWYYYSCYKPAQAEREWNSRQAHPTSIVLPEI